MEIGTILTPVLILGGMGLLFGIGLGVAAIKFKVEEDPLVPAIRAALPGANCGGCGYAGCDALAEAMAKGEAPPSACPVGGPSCAKAVAEILGVDAGDVERKNAFVRCGGCEGKAKFRYTYQGLHDCKAAMQLASGGSKSCSYGCLGGGSCIAACQFGAISYKDGIAVIDKDKCTACGMCIKACPKNLIAFERYDCKTRVLCSSKDLGKVVRQNCTVGCIACKLCVKACEYGAIQVTNNVASVDPAKCVSCGACARKCPAKCISTSVALEEKPAAQA
ncbi:MAG: RnfABCDGE type electron transport complex subunit B [Clostridiales bacterium]|nr:RnfABCDGE type electron transport complex subunit B [Clostridiales bacterium]